MNKTHRSRRARTVAVSVVAAFLVWQIGARSLAAYLAEVAPATALWFQPQQPSALVNLADRTLNAAKDGARASAADQASQRQRHAADSTTHVADSRDAYWQNLDSAFSAFETVGRNQSVNRPILPGNASTIRAWAETALLNAPLDARALRILGQLAEAGGDDASAVNFMRAAARLSLHENIADDWLMRKSAQARDYKSAIYYADVLLRTSPELSRYVVPVLARAAEDGGSVGRLKAVLAADPPWRAEFFAALPRSVTDARTPLDLLLALRNSRKPPTSADVGVYVDFLVGRRLYGLAYYTWLQFLPPEELRHVGLLFNGNFAAPPSGLPFDWVITPGSGVTVDIVPKPNSNGGHALLVDFQYGRVEYHSVTQLIMLSPGTYELKGKYKGELNGPRGLKWRIVCAGGTASIVGESPMIIGLTTDWRTMAFTFTVPASGCRAQRLRLDLDTRMASEELITGSMLFDELQISRSANPPS